jgi:AraC-like DNA-binding protein
VLRATDAVQKDNLVPLPADATLIHYSTDYFPERDRVALWREVFGRTVLRLDIEPLPDRQFYSDIKLRAFNGLVVGAGEFCGVREQRTENLAADGNDDLCLFVNAAGRYIVSQRGRDLTLDQGDGFFTSHSEMATYLRPSLGRVVGIIVSRAALAPFMAGVNDAIGSQIRRDTLALKLLTNYLGGLDDVDALTTPALRNTVAAHILDLFALAVGATGDMAALARGRGGRAARLRAIKVDIAENLGRRDLGVTAVALRHAVTPRQIHRLFETEGTTFSEFVLDVRLAHAHRMLSDPRRVALTIGAIALGAGFADRSHFNRAFRRRYGSSPSDFRAAAWHSDDR